MILERLIDAAYATQLDAQTWLAGVVAEARPFLDQGLGVLGLRFEIGDPSAPVVREPIFLGTPAGSEEALEAMVRGAPGGLFASMLRPTPSCATLSDRLLAIGIDIRKTPLHEHVLAPLGVHDFVSIAAMDATGAGCLVGAPLPRLTCADDLAGALWPTIAAHLAAAMRGRAPAADASSTNHAAQAAPVWTELALGRWTELDAFDRSGERFLVARRADDAPPTERAPLSAREREIVELAAVGRSNKVIAFDLGIAPSTVAGHLTKAAAKLGAASRVELLQVWELRKRPSGA